MNLELANQVTVVVGGAHGIGRAIALAFAEEGAPVAILDRDPEALNVAQEAAQFGVHSWGLVVDVTDYPALMQAAAHVETELGPVMHVVFSVGIDSGKGGFPFWNLEPSDWPRVYAVNVQGAVNTAHVFYAGLIQRRQGTMLFLSSVAGQIGSQTDPPYSASKAALINFAQCAAKDLGPYNVRVNTICPGMVDTPLQHRVYSLSVAHLPPEERPSYEEWCEEKIRRKAPLGRMQTPEDIANMAVFLASPRAQNITGQTINVDGGFVMHW
ncbi:MAG: SDR family oxidoreductase [Caldilineae bacterium]|nr:MAG: SDR family oxidoreductase [Caldilineae bacterium]